MPRSGKSTKIKSLASGRPKGIVKSAGRHQSAKATRTTIRTHHTLCKELSRAEADKDFEKVSRLEQEIANNGGLKAYQSASVTGQSTSRGGDSSRVLLDWLNESYADELGLFSKTRKLRVLEVGSLSTKNALSQCGFFDVERIDLNSQEKGILKQDFMLRPLPSDDDRHSSCFDMISLSLVLNYVPDACERGSMLRRTTRFLRRDKQSKFLPSLFLVLPAPCVTNSRYLDEELLKVIMEALGYAQICRKISSKLIYSLWRWSSTEQLNHRNFPKKQISPGKTRNNFAIVLN